MNVVYDGLNHRDYIGGEKYVRMFVLPALFGISTEEFDELLITAHAVLETITLLDDPNAFDVMAFLNSELYNEIVFQPRAFLNNASLPDISIFEFIAALLFIKHPLFLTLIAPEDQISLVFACSLLFLALVADADNECYKRRPDQQISFLLRPYYALGATVRHMRV